MVEEQIIDYANEKLKELKLRANKDQEERKEEIEMEIEPEPKPEPKPPPSAKKATKPTDISQLNLLSRLQAIRGEKETKTWNLDKSFDVRAKGHFEGVSLKEFKERMIGKNGEGGLRQHFNDLSKLHEDGATKVQDEITDLFENEKTKAEIYKDDIAEYNEVNRKFTLTNTSDDGEIQEIVNIQHDGKETVTVDCPDLTTNINILKSMKALRRTARDEKITMDECSDLKTALKLLAFGTQLGLDIEINYDGIDKNFGIKEKTFKELAQEIKVLHKTTDPKEAYEKMLQRIEEVCDREKTMFFKKSSKNEMVKKQTIKKGNSKFNEMKSNSKKKKKNKGKK